MNFANLFRIALRALGNNKMRGFLTMLGIIIGVASVITMLAIGQGSKRSIRAQIAEMEMCIRDRIIALLAGSRSQELRYVLPAMLRMVDHFPDYQFVIAGAPSMSDADYAPYLKGREVRILYGQTYRLLSQAKAALAVSYTHLVSP